jgi:hypothetical protein
MLRQHGFELVVEPISFLVDRHDHHLPGEEERAERWGATLGEKRPKPVVVPERFEHLGPPCPEGLRARLLRDEWIWRRSTGGQMLKSVTS